MVFKGIYVIFKREMMSYFVSPIAYVVAFLFIFLTGVLFVSFIGSTPTYLGGAQANVGLLLRNYLILILFLCPILTIKLFSEEKRSGTLELILTSPISTLSLVVGKYLSAFALYAIILLTTLVHVFIMDIYSEAGPDYGVAFSAYLGLLFLGGGMLGIGLFTSSLTSSQIIAAISGLSASLFFLLLHTFVSGDSGIINEAIREFSLLSHYIDFDKGVLDTTNILYYLLWIIFSLVLTNKAVEAHIWK